MSENRCGLAPSYFVFVGHRAPAVLMKVEMQAYTNERCLQTFSNTASSSLPDYVNENALCAANGLLGGRDACTVRAPREFLAFSVCASMCLCVFLSHPYTLSLSLSSLSLSLSLSPSFSLPLSPSLSHTDTTILSHSFLP